ncbi:glycine zipper 2TM domain-containing protein [Massilia sp. RP-1-19]|uniref:Glycine zipper 2TM domain-containing protein n=1 Tax=Massilia polaris TaxID=2728846 RepID=A0A848HLX9_9BURK|nr:glycine zipper 2TM domain-containing protein [Massilia polaris]NML62037.1 glycine zipper 2TM domain-containing protein [Massilia polaris]
MESIQTATRIHPLMAAAALSVITVSIAGTAAITGLLPTSKADVPVSVAAPAPAAYYAAPAPLPVAVKAAAPLRLAAYDEEPAPKPKPKPKPRPRPQPKEVHHHHVAQNDAPTYQAPAVQPAPKQPNYVGIGAGAVIGGLLGNQVGGGNGKKLATLAGIIGGGMIGNEIQNRTSR